MSEPQFRIKDKVYPVPQNERLGELRLIERVTGVTHREFRVRAIEQQERFERLDDDADLTARQVLELLDDVVTIARIAQAVQRANPRWSTERVAEFVDALDEGDVVMEGGQEDPPASGAQDAPTSSANGTDSAGQSKSDSDTASSESAIPVTSGT